MKAPQLFLFAAYAICVCGCSQKSDVPTGEEVLARVNDAVITRRDVDVQSRTHGNEKRDLALDDLINRELVLQEFKAKGYNLAEKIIDDRIERIISEKFLGERSSFIADLKKQGRTLEEFRKRERDKVIIEAMRQKIVQDAHTPSERGKKWDAWLASLRKKASISVY